MRDVPVRKHVRHLNRRVLSGSHRRLLGAQQLRERRFSPEELRRLARVDYVELRAGPWVYEGFSCENCRFFNGAMCTLPAVDAPVVPNGCCNAFSNDNKEQFRARKAFKQ